MARNRLGLFVKGDRVQAHPSTGAWMSGDRFGVVVGRTRSRLHDTDTFGVRVLMDVSEDIRVFHPDNLLLGGNAAPHV